MAGETETSSATVLVVEDSLVSRRMVVRGVREQGHAVLQAVDGGEALRTLAERSVDMVLLDLLMPEVDGFEVLATMQRDPRLRDIPVLVISAVEATDDIARAIEMGAIDCLAKPVDPVLLRVRLRTTLDNIRLRRMERAYLQQELALRQQERLATLGRLSAGLGHELNNPAAAALSAARQLTGVLADSDRVRGELVERERSGLIADAVDRWIPDPASLPATARQQAIDADAIADVLIAAGIQDPWSHADALVAEGVDTGAITSLVEELGEDVELGLAWYRARLATRRTLRHITTSLERIADLTAALRGYSYLDRAPQQDLDVRAGLEDTLRILDHKRPPGVEVIRDHEAGLPTIHGYGGQLNQVWTNLLDNAIDAVGDTGTVIVRTRRSPDGDAVDVEVEDDGPGIATELLGRVFDPFVTTKAPGEGTGLGLNIAHQIVTEGHLGDLTVESVPGRTVFRAHLPRRPDTARTTRDATETAVGGATDRGG